MAPVKENRKGVKLRRTEPSFSPRQKIYEPFRWKPKYLAGTWNPFTINSVRECESRGRESVRVERVEKFFSEKETLVLFFSDLAEYIATVVARNLSSISWSKDQYFQKISVDTILLRFLVETATIWLFYIFPFLFT